MKVEVMVMFEFLAGNIGTILTGIVLLGIIAAVIFTIRRDKKKGGCVGCNGCSCKTPEECKMNNTIVNK